MLAVALVASGCQQNTGTETVQINNDLVSSSSGTQALVVQSSTPKQEVATSSVGKVSSTKPTVKTVSTTPEKKTAEIPRELTLAVAFAQQAPYGNWDALHEEACEEASMIMVNKYFVHQSLNETIMETEIQKLISWEGDNGYLVDLTAQEAVDILNNHFGLKARLSTEVTADRIKYELSQGNLIIIPAAGRLLGNPNFKQPGPIYHMLVIKGYNNSEFITNDPGTRKGNSFKYKYNQLINAVHDWNHELAEGGMTDAEMAMGRKVMIVVEK
jgi:hypothetical protein